MKNERGQTGLVGEYAVLSALILNGFNAARMDGNSRDIDILCTNSEFAKATKIQVKAEGPNTYYRRNKHSLPDYAFHVVDRKKYQTSYRKTILEQRIHFVFYLCPQTKEALETKPFDKNRTYGRFFIATPEEVVKQLDYKLTFEKSAQLYFHVLEEYDERRTAEYGYLMNELENRWDKLIC